jgi:hypothetical protein
MGPSSYGFAFFVFLLLCVFALLCKVLFLRDKSFVRKMLDDKEKKLLTLYGSMEDMMDEFNQTALAANEEINRHINKMHNAKAAIEQTPPPPPVRPAAVPPPAPAIVPLPVMPAAEINFGLGLTATPTVPATPAAQEFNRLTLPEVKIKKEQQPTRPTRILALHNQGMDRLHIAKELAVTLSELDLVLGLAKKARA